MNFNRIFFMIIVFMTVIFISCTTNHSKNIQKLSRKPTIVPDYSSVTIPPNIAPMNFLIQEEGDLFKITVTTSSIDSKLSITSTDGIVRFPKNKWKALLNDSKGESIKIQIASLKEGMDTLNLYQPIYMHIANEPIDPYLTYRLLYPGYESWNEMQIMQRSLENFKEKSLVENQLLEMNCINCHSFHQNNPDKFLLHIRGSKGGTYFIENEKIVRTVLKTENLPAGATYPAWHPSGKYVAFSSNNVKQSFYALSNQSIEVFDLFSTLILYDIQKNEIMQLHDDDSIPYMSTFPSWSPDGNYLYFCRSQQVKEDYSVETVKNIHYDLVRKRFDPESRSFGKTEMVFEASKKGKSVSFPKISPDGNYLVFTLHDYGTFPIWHREADLYLINLINGECIPMNLNSDETESYHAWSSNGRWLVFSSKRGDGRSARPYFAWFGPSGETGKPFVLPQQDPTRYHTMLKTFNIPEFVKGKIDLGPRNFARTASTKPLTPNNFKSK